ncbi:hypothetical protein LR48_Vigan407s000300 [Vigna angularis]|uniref:Uncharacterized protein n=1 Tax=Phaseolus angularis TaxID=3914 RepID=A0A0L9TA48_PHAAN|nr:hypothetical protein LR48_Vigan407s000300 [Vigna angularis]
MPLSSVAAATSTTTVHLLLSRRRINGPPFPPPQRLNHSAATAPSTIKPPQATTTLLAHHLHLLPSVAGIITAAQPRTTVNLQTTPPASIKIKRTNHPESRSSSRLSSRVRQTASVTTAPPPHSDLHHQSPSLIATSPRRTPCRLHATRALPLQHCHCHGFNHLAAVARPSSRQIIISDLQIQKPRKPNPNKARTPSSPRHLLVESSPQGLSSTITAHQSRPPPLGESLHRRATNRTSITSKSITEVAEQCGTEKALSPNLQNLNFGKNLFTFSDTGLTFLLKVNFSINLNVQSLTNVTKKIRPKPKIVPLSGKCVSCFPPLSGLFTPQRSQRGFLSVAQRNPSRQCRQPSFRFRRTILFHRTATTAPPLRLRHASSSATSIIFFASPWRAATPTSSPSFLAGKPPLTITTVHLLHPLARHHQNRKSPPKAAVRTAIRVHLHLGSSLAIFRNHAAYCFSKIVPQRFNTHQPPRPSSRFSSILAAATASNRHHQIASVTAARPSRRDLHRHSLILLSLFFHLVFNSIHGELSI